MDKVVIEKLGLRRPREASRHNGFVEYEAIETKTKDKWRIWSANKKAQGKLLKWYEAVASVAMDDCEYLRKADTVSGVWVAQRRLYGVPIASVIADSEWRLGEVLSLTLQLINALQILVEKEIALHSPCFEDMRANKGASEFFQLNFTGLSPVASETLEEQSAAHIAGRFIYTLLTGNIPPTEDEALENTVEGERLTGFDSLLVDWVEEHQFPSGLGELALQAYMDEIDLKTLAEALFPYFEREVAKLAAEVQSGTEGLDDALRDRTSSEARVQELESLINVHETWLHSKHEAIELAEQRVVRVEQALRQLEMLESEVTGLLGLDSKVNYQLAGASVTQEFAEENDHVGQEPTREEPSRIELDPDQFWPDDPKLRPSKNLGHPEAEDVRVTSALNQSQEESASEGYVSPFYIGIGLGFLLCLILWGVMGVDRDGAPAENSLSSMSNDRQLSPGAAHSVDSHLVSSNSVKRMPVDASPAVRRSASKRLDLGVNHIVDAQGIGVVATAGERSPSPEIDAAVDEGDEGLVQPVVSTPEGMIRLDGGVLLQGITNDQRVRLFDSCARIVGRGSQRCLEITAEPALTNSEVRVQPFALDVTEVDYTQYVQCVIAGRCPKPAHKWNKPRFPVTGVSVNAAQSFCNWKGKRLPTEAEWMFAVRASGGKRLFPWGDSLPSKERANLGRWENERVTDSSDGHRYVAPVKSFSKGVTQGGALNMVGNVKEIVRVVGEEESFAAKGAGYLSLGFEARVTARQPVSLRSNSTELGFRCALSM